MKTLSRKELTQISGGKIVDNCGWIHCSCETGGWHPEWGEWDAYYCTWADAQSDINTFCGAGEPGQITGQCYYL